MIARVDVGVEVGYAVRFDEKTSVGMHIRYVTDGVLLRERDDTWPRYYHDIVDEVHERSVNTDLVLRAARRRPAAQEKLQAGRRVGHQ